MLAQRVKHYMLLDCFTPTNDANEGDDTYNKKAGNCPPSYYMCSIIFIAPNSKPDFYAVHCASAGGNRYRL